MLSGRYLSLSILRDYSTNYMCTAGLKRTRHLIGMVIKIFHRLENFFAGLLAYRAAIIHNTRNRCNAYTGSLSNILYRCHSDHTYLLTVLHILCGNNYDMNKP